MEHSILIVPTIMTARCRHSVVVCADLSRKEPHRQVGMDKVVISGSLGDVIVSKLDWNARDLGSIPILD